MGTEQQQEQEFLSFWVDTNLRVGVR